MRDSYGHHHGYCVELVNILSGNDNVKFRSFCRAHWAQKEHFFVICVIASVVYDTASMQNKRLAAPCRARAVARVLWLVVSKPIPHERLHVNGRPMMKQSYGKKGK